LPTFTKFARAQINADLISDALPFGRLWYDTPDNAISYAQHYSRSHDAVIRVYDDAGNVIETHQHKGELAILQPFTANFPRWKLK